jgi:hydroxyquinol 1,2-dioxygenase
VKGRWYSLDHHFVIFAGDDSLPPAPISAKATGDRPELVVLQASAT